MKLTREQLVSILTNELDLIEADFTSDDCELNDLQELQRELEEWIAELKENPSLASLNEGQPLLKRAARMEKLMMRKARVLARQWNRQTEVQASEPDPEPEPSNPPALPEPDTLPVPNPAQLTAPTPERANPSKSITPNPEPTALPPSGALKTEPPVNVNPEPAPAPAPEPPQKLRPKAL